MPVTYEMSDDKALDLMKKTIEQYHPDINRYGVRIGLISAFGQRNDEGELEKPALMKSGAKCAAKVRIVGLKDRLMKNLDVEVLIDGDYWQELDDARKIAILDHELEHIVIQVDSESGAVKTDSLDRPRLRLINDDIQFWGFSRIAERHKENSQECLCFKQMVARYGDILKAK